MSNITKSQSGKLFQMASPPMSAAKKTLSERGSSIFPVRETLPRYRATKPSAKSVAAAANSMPTVKNVVSFSLFKLYKSGNDRKMRETLRALASNILFH